MKVIAKPTKEKRVLASVKKGAKPDEIHKGIIARGEACVVHLCGCASGC